MGTFRGRPCRRGDSCKLRSSHRLTDPTQSTKMASWREVARPLRQLRTPQIPRRAAVPVCARRWYSAEAAAAAPVEESPFDSLEPEPSLGAPGPTPEQEKEYATPEPWKRAKDRKYELPASRYVRPLHPKALASFDRAPPNGVRVRYASKQADQLSMTTADTNTIHPNSTADPSIPSSPRPPPTPSPATSNRAPSTSRASGRRGRRASRRTC